MHLLTLVAEVTYLCFCRSHLTSRMSLSLEAKLSSLPSQQQMQRGAEDDEKSETSFEDYVSLMSGSVCFDVHNGKVVEPMVQKDVDPFDDGNVRENQWTPKNSFLAESPYFHAFVEKEMHDMEIVTAVLSDIAEQTAAYTKYASMMADAGIRLSKSCRLRKEEGTVGDNRMTPGQLNEEVEKRRNALGSEISEILGVLGEVGFGTCLMRH